MKLSCIGCGPGDPDLLTIKAVDRIKEADAIFTPTSKEGKPSIKAEVIQLTKHEFNNIWLAYQKACHRVTTFGKGIYDKIEKMFARCTIIN